jgi:hypothetical protein
MSLFSGKKIPLPTDEKNVLSLAYQEELVRTANAFLGLKVKGGKLAISDNNAELVIDGAAGGSSSTTTSDLPWQITLQDTPDGRTFQVGIGYATPCQRPGFLYLPPAIYASSGHDTNITATASTSYLVWARCLDGVAEIQHGVLTDIPSDWVNYPAIQAYDNDYPSYVTYAYFLIGVVDTTASPTTITQYISHNPQIEWVPSDIVMFKGAWNSGGIYRQNTIVFYSGNTYIRTGLAFGNSGGTPSGAFDWEVI